MSKMERMQRDQVNKLVKMSEAMEKQRRILEGILEAINSQTNDFTRDLSDLKNTMNNVGENVRKLTDVTIDIEEAKAIAARDTKRSLLEHAKTIWARARDRFANQYDKIISDYVRGLVENVQRFCRLVSDELSPLFRIKNATIDYQSIVEDMEPRLADTLRVEAALAMSGSRAKKLNQEYGFARNNLTNFVQERKDLVDKIESTRIPSDFLSIESFAPGEIVLLNIPMHLAKLEGPNGEEKVIRITPSRVISDSEDPYLQEDLETICPELHAATESAPRFSHEQLLVDAERDNILATEGTKTVEQTLNHMKKAGANSILVSAVQKFYEERFDQWTPDSRTAQEIETSDVMETPQEVEMVEEVEAE